MPSRTYAIVTSLRTWAWYTAKSFGLGAVVMLRSLAGVTETTTRMPGPDADVIDALVGIAPGSALDAVRARLIGGVPPVAGSGLLVMPKFVPPSSQR